MQTFDLKINPGYGELKISDQLDTPIRDFTVLKYVIDVFAKSGSFYLKLDFSQEMSKTITHQVRA